MGAFSDEFPDDDEYDVEYDEVAHDDQIDRQIVLVLLRDLDEGIRRLDARYRRPVCGGLRHWSDKYGRELQPADLRDIWQDALVRLAVKIVNGRFSQEGKVGALMYRAVRYSALTFLDKRSRFPETIDSIGDEAVEKRVRQAVESSDRQNADYMRIDGPHNLADLLREQAVKFSLLESTTFTLWLYHYELTGEFLGNAELTAAVSVALGEEKSLNSVDSAFQRAKAKSSKFLIRVGYSCD